LIPRQVPLYYSLDPDYVEEISRSFHYFLQDNLITRKKMSGKFDANDVDYNDPDEFIIQERGAPETPHPHPQPETPDTPLTEANVVENDQQEEALDRMSTAESEAEAEAEADDWDEYSMAGDGQETGADLVQLSQQAIAALRNILLTRVRADPVHSMGLTALNSVSTWSRTFAPLKSMKKWINITLPTLNLPHKLIVVNGINPGTDIVQWADAPAQPVQRATFLPPPAGLAVPITYARRVPLLPAVHVPRGGGHAHAHAHVHVGGVDAGVQVRDFFHIPMIQNSTETSYIKSTKKTTDMFAYFVRTGALRAALEYERGQFDELEWRGDAVLHLEITNIQFVSQANLYDVGGLSIRRQNAEQRLTLALLFDDFHLAQFMRVCPESWTRDTWKVKGDIVEAMIGELYTRLNDATEEGLPFGHRDRRAAFDLIKRLAQAALERGLMLISHAEQDRLRAAAEAPGGGGFLLTADDREATIRCAANGDNNAL
jgi:hypothetical protein